MCFDLHVFLMCFQNLRVDLLRSCGVVVLFFLDPVVLCSCSCEVKSRVVVFCSVEDISRIGKFVFCSFTIFIKTMFVRLSTVCIICLTKCFSKNLKGFFMQKSSKRMYCVVDRCTCYFRCQALNVFVIFA